MLVYIFAQKCKQSGGVYTPPLVYILFPFFFVYFPRSEVGDFKDALLGPSSPVRFQPPTADLLTHVLGGDG